MRNIFVLVVMMLALSPLASSQTKDTNGRDAKAEQQLREMVRAWDEADVKGDTTTLARLLADEFSFVGGPDKAQYLASIKSPPPDSSVESALSVDVNVQIYGDAAIVTGLDTVKGKNKGKAYVNRWMFMDVWIRRAGRWQCVKTHLNLMNGHQNANQG